MSALLVGNVAATKRSDSNSTTIPRLSWAPGAPFPVVRGRTIFPTLPPPADGPPTYGTHWYAGSVYLGAPGEATIVYASFKVPVSQPRSDEFYYVLLSVWDSAGSYDQIGFADNYGVWGLTYSWTTGTPDNPTYIYTPDAITLIPGEYTFSISTSDGFTTFSVVTGSCDPATMSTLPCTGGHRFWSLVAPTGGNYLRVQAYSFGYYGYTDYEEIWDTHASHGSPNFNFFFYNNRWGSTVDASVYAQWNSWVTESMPGNVVINVDGNTVYVHNGIW